MVCYTFVIAVINTSYRLTVNTDSLAGMRQRAGISVMSFSLLSKALAAGIITFAGMLSAHHNVPFTTVAIVIIGTVRHRTF